MYIPKSKSVTNTKQTTVKTEKNNVNSNIDYSKYFANNVSLNPNYIKPNSKSDKEILDIVNDRYSSLYDSYLSSNSAMKDLEISNLNEKKAAIEPEFAQKIEQIKNNYKVNSQNISDSTLKRGIGRSSISVQMQRDNDLERDNKISQTEKDKQDKISNYDNEIANVGVKYSANENEIIAKKDFEMNKLKFDLEKERAKELLDAQKYNNSLYESHTKMLLDQQKYNLNVQKYIDSLNTVKTTITTTNKTVTRTTYSYGFNTSKSSNETTKDTIPTWGRGTGASRSF